MTTMSNVNQCVAQHAAKRAQGKLAWILHFEGAVAAAASVAVAEWKALED
jgi:hypothetical protein